MMFMMVMTVRPRLPQANIGNGMSSLPWFKTSHRVIHATVAILKIMYVPGKQKGYNFIMVDFSEHSFAK